LFLHENLMFADWMAYSMRDWKEEWTEEVFVEPEGGQ